MKVFRVVLSGVGPTYVEADRYEAADTVRFFRGDVVVNEYLPGLVKEITEAPLPSGGGTLFTAEIPSD